MDDRRLIASFVLRLFGGQAREYEVIDLRTGESRRVATLADLLAQLLRWTDESADDPVDGDVT